MRITRFIILLFLFCIAAGYPLLSGYVEDQAHLLSTTEEDYLEKIITAFIKEREIEIAIVTIDTTNGMDPVIYANHIGEENGVGNEDLDSGIVILWSEKEGGAIAVGRGIHGVLNDAKVARIGREYRYLFDQNRYYEGFLKILSDIYNETEDYDRYSSMNSSGDTDYFFIVLFILVILIIILSTKQNNKGTWTSLGYFGGNFNHSGWGGFKGGSFGGGGGKF